MSPRDAHSVAQIRSATMSANTKIEKLKQKYQEAQEAANTAQLVADAAALTVLSAAYDLKSVLPVSKDADDYKIVISGDGSWGWSSVQVMLDDVFGDVWCECEGGHLSVHGECEPSAVAQDYIDAFEGGDGVYAFHGALYMRDPVTGEWGEDAEDSCSGFFSCDASVPVEAIKDTLLPSDLVGDVEIEEES